MAIKKTSNTVFDYTWAKKKLDEDGVEPQEQAPKKITFD